jgi:alpha-glucosidase
VRIAITSAVADPEIAKRYRLLDYFYTAFNQASIDGSPVLSLLWFNYSQDTSTYDTDLQFFGDSMLVSPGPVTDENATSVSISLPPSSTTS